MIAQVENGRVLRVVGDPDHPITRGYLCGRFQHYEELIHHEDRLLHPLARERKTDPLEPVSWDEALDMVATNFRRVVEEHGPEAILPYRYFGNMGVLGTNYADRLWNAIGTSRVGMEICAIAGIEALLRVFGRIRGTEPQFAPLTRMFIAWGKNPKETNIHGWVNDFRNIHPLVVIDPFESDTAAAADIFLKIKPATDSLLAMGMMRLLIENGWVDRDFVEQRTIGFDALRDKVLQVSLDDVAAGTGIQRARIEEVTRLYAEHQPALIQIGQGLQRNLNGGEIVANICMLAAIAGQVGVRGGGVFYSNFEWNHKDIGHPEFRTGGTRMYNMIKLGRWLTETDEIQALYVYNSNPVVTCPNQNLVKRGIGREDLFVVVHDLFPTDTARLANVVLPACSFAEQWDLHYSYWHDYVQVNSPVIPPVGESRSNVRVFNEIAKRMGFTDACFDQTEEDVLAEALQGTGLDLDELKRGPVFIGDMERTSFADGRFGTPSGKIELLEPTFSPYEDERHGYRLLSPKTKHLHSSQGYILPSIRRQLREADFFIHPHDAELEGLADGDPVRLWNERGEVRLVARVSERTQPDVLVSYNGRWGDNVNATTSDDEADWGGQSIFQSNWVSVERL
jgi:anaerobic selenocysteine-containing dehydrogenase